MRSYKRNSLDIRMLSLQSKLPFFVSSFNVISNFLDYGKLTAGVAIDFSKALEMVNHTISLKKLNQYHIKISVITGSNVI